MEFDLSNIREKAYQVCGKFLGGIWENVTKDDLILQPLSGGFLNYIVKVSLPSTFSPNGNEPTVILMKQFMDLVEREYFAKIKENITVILLAKKKLAPKVYGIFDGGRLDEYIPSRTLKPHELYNPILLKSIVRQFAQMHTLTLPFTKNPNEMFNLIKSFLTPALQDIRNKESNPERQSLLKKLTSLSPYEEFYWLEKKVEEANSPVVFCHNDLQINNFLLRENPLDEPIQLVDFEMSGYGYRGMEFGYFYRSFCLESHLPHPPYFKADWTKFPSEEVQKQIIHIYFEQYQKHSNEIVDIKTEETKLLQEYKIFVLLTNFALILFTLCRVDKIETKMDWLSFGHEMYDSYIMFKKKYFDI